MLDLPRLAWIRYPGEATEQDGQLGREEARLFHDRYRAFLTFLFGGFEGDASVRGATGSRAGTRRLLTCRLTFFTRRFAPFG